MHGSDSTSYTAQGDFDEARFDHTFELYTQPPHTGMSYGEAITMLNGQRNAYDFVSVALLDAYMRPDQRFCVVRVARSVVRVVCDIHTPVARRRVDEEGRYSWHLRCMSRFAFTVFSARRSLNVY